MALRKYREVARGQRLPGFVRSRRRKLNINSLQQMSTEELWSVHNLAEKASRASHFEASYLDIKIELAKRALGKCGLCERKCGANRLAGQTGFCGVGMHSSYFIEQTLWGEEPPVVPSHEVFFSGCNLRCKYCYSWQSLFDTQRGTQLDPKAFSKIIDARRMEGAANINLIGGEPTVHLPNILESLNLVQKPTAVVWNSNFYMSSDTMQLLDGVVDLYLGDFRFGNDECARSIGGVTGYVEAAKRNFIEASHSADLVIRHLVMPGHVDCCLRPVAEWAAEKMPGVPFNLMFQYTPFHEALDDPRLCRYLTAEEENAAMGIVKSLGLNITRWKQPLRRDITASGIGKGQLDTTITIQPDGRIAIMHLHGELLSIVEALAKGGQQDE